MLCFVKLSLSLLPYGIFEIKITLFLKHQSNYLDIPIRMIIANLAGQTVFANIMKQAQESLAAAMSLSGNITS